MANILLVCPLEDQQSGRYLHDSIIRLGHSVAYFDWKLIYASKGVKETNEMFLESIELLKPDLTLIIKYPFLTSDVVSKAREIHQHKIVGWIFDVTIGGTLVSKVDEYVDTIKEFDVFYTIDNDAVGELRELGVNASWLSEGCFLPDHGEQIFNYIQRKKYGEDVVFLGSVGGIHPNRNSYLKRLHDEGIKYKLYGEVYYEENKEPNFVRDHHTGFEAINDYHSIVCGASNIVLGVDGWPDRDKSYSARLYRTLAAGGFYLTTHTKNIEQEFVPGVHLDTFRNEDELIQKVLFYLTNDELREKIAKEGQKKVLEEHQFIHRLKKLFDENL